MLKIKYIENGSGIESFCCLYQLKDEAQMKEFFCQ